MKSKEREAIEKAINTYNRNEDCSAAEFFIKNADNIKSGNYTDEMKEYIYRLVAQTIENDDSHTRWNYESYLSKKDYLANRKSSFDKIVEKFKEAGYKMPKITFWNLKSRTRGIPLKENELGVNLVSGFSPAVVKLVMTEKSDPYEALKEILDSNRYKPVADAIDLK